MKAKKLKDLPAERHETPYPHSIYWRKPLTWSNKEIFALIVVQPAGGEGPRKEWRFHATTLYVKAKDLTYYGVAHGTYEVVSLGNDPDDAWHHFIVWCGVHLEQLIRDLATGKKPKLTTVFCPPRPKQLNLL